MDEKHRFFGKLCLNFQHSFIFMTIIVTGLTAQASGSFSCSSIFTETEIVLDASNRTNIIEEPEKYLYKKIKSKSDRDGSPFRIVERARLPEHLNTVIDDLHVLSRNDNLRAKVFGNAKSIGEYQTELRETPLELKNKDDQRGWGFFVETGVEVLHLDNGSRLYVYTTSNSQNSIEKPYEFYLDLISTIKSRGRTVVAVDSFHTHPLNLLPSIMDQTYFTNQIRLLKKEYPDLNITAWTMRTTMDSEAVVHEVNLADWY